MERRQFLRSAGGVASGLAAVGLAGASGTLAGCVAAPASADAATCEGEAPPPADAGAPLLPPATGDVDLPVPRDELVTGALPGDIQAITEPAFARDWAGLEDPLSPGEPVIGVERAGQARAYPLATLTGHEAVNDDLGGPLLVTYCPLCATAVTAVREVAGEETVFTVSGKLFRSNLVLTDRQTGSLWSQVLARAIRGPATGDRLTLVPSTLATWGDWRERHPDTEVLLPPPASGTAGHIPGRVRADSGHVGVGDVGLAFDDDRLPRTAYVVGVAAGDAARAYPQAQVAGAGVVNDCVGGLPVVVANRTVPYAYDRRVAGEPRWFERVGSNRLRAAGTIWSITSGRAVAGRHAGSRLRRAAGSARMYWFAWLDFHPTTTVYTG